MTAMGELLLVRHGETEWSRTHRHTGRTDLPLTQHGEAQARSLADRLAGVPVAFTSPLQRARRTAELAGFPAAVVDEDLIEWDNGDYESRTTADIRTERPGWWIWTDPPPGGESAADVEVRCGRTLQHVAPLLEQSDVILFGHGHSLRALAGVWVGWGAAGGAAFTLDAGGICVLGTYRDHRVVMRWNDISAHPLEST